MPVAAFLGTTMATLHGERERKIIKTLGYKIMYQPKSEIIHFIGQSFNEKASKLMEINHQKFYDKWSNK